MVVVALVSIAAGVLGGMLARSVVLDIVSLWPLLLGAFLVAAALLPLRKRGPARIAAALPLLLITVLGVSVVLHLIGWERLPSSAANLVGPPSAGVAQSNLTLELSGNLTIAAGGQDLYRVTIERGGGDTGVPEALESQFEEGPFFVLLQETDGGSWFQSAGWEVGLAPQPSWTLDIGAADLRADLTGLPLEAVTLRGSGRAVLPAPGEGEVSLFVEGDFAVEVPSAVRVEIVGEATVPGGWPETTGGYRNLFDGPGFVIEVADGAQVEVSQQ